jgi:hypothetical protein
MQRKLNVRRLIEDVGGAKAASDATGAPRTAPYRWIKTGRFSVGVLERLKAAAPHLDLDDYFEEVVS